MTIPPPCFQNSLTRARIGEVTKTYPSNRHSITSIDSETADERTTTGAAEAENIGPLDQQRSERRLSRRVTG